MADEEWARGVHPSSDWCTELTEADITEVLQLAAGRFPDDGERHHLMMMSHHFLLGNDTPSLFGG